MSFLKKVSVSFGDVTSSSLYFFIHSFFSGSESTWQEMKSINIILEQRRKDKLRRKIRGLMRTTYLLIRIHNASIEKLLHPDSQFVNNVLKPEFEKNAN